MQQLRNHGPHCVACGEDNPGSLGMTFALGDDGRVHAALRLDERHQGAPGFAHGGLIATALDDTLGTVVTITGRPAVTARLSIEYHEPLFIHTDYTVSAWEESSEGRKVHLRGEIRDGEGRLVAEADALFILVSIEHFTQGDHALPAHVLERWHERQAERPR